VRALRTISHDRGLEPSSRLRNLLQCADVFSSALATLQLGFVNRPGESAPGLFLVERLCQERTKLLNPAINSRGTDDDAGLGQLSHIRTGKPLDIGSASTRREEL
jgi:hypothetical protein